MNVWGLAYNQCSAYFDQMGMLVDPVVSNLGTIIKCATKSEKDEIPTLVDPHLRMAVVVTHRMLAAVDDLTLAKGQILTIQSGIDTLRGNIPEVAPTVEDPDKYIELVTQEMNVVQEWLDHVEEIQEIEDHVMRFVFR